MNGSAKVNFGLQNSKTFCVLPWVNISTDPDGSIKPCCVSMDTIKKPDNTFYNLGSDTIEEIYNSDHFVEIRKKMLAGQKVEGCQNCYTQELQGSQSHRQIYNNVYRGKYFSEIVEPKIKYFDLRFGNLCNLKCRSCNPRNSSQIVKEVSSLQHTNINEFHFKIDKISNNDWFNSETFNDNLEKNIDHIDLIYVTGGEPTLIDENLKFLQKLVTLGKSKNITVKFNSNITNINKEFYEILDQFKSIYFFASIDGYQEIQEYLRYPSKWVSIDNNIKKLIQLKNITIQPTPVIQIGNLNKIVDLFEYFENFNRLYNRRVFAIHPIVLEFPDIFNIKYLPLSYKTECLEEIQKWIKTKCKFQNQFFMNKMQSVKNLCTVDYYDKDKLDKFLEFNNILDVHRNHYLKDVNKSLYNLLSI